MMKNLKVRDISCTNIPIDIHVFVRAETVVTYSTAVVHNIMTIVQAIIVSELSI